jgi:hypothetical protein
VAVRRNFPRFVAAIHLMALANARLPHRQRAGGTFGSQGAFPALDECRNQHGIKSV